MTTATMTRAVAARVPFQGLAAALVAWISKRIAYAETLQELNALSDRDLADLGFARCDLRRIAAEAAGLR